MSVKGLLRTSGVFYTLYNRPKTVGEVFDYMYNWRWLDPDTGEILEDKVDQGRQLQSVPVITTQEIVNNFSDLGVLPAGFQLGTEEDNIVDTTGLDNGDLPSVIRYLASLQASIQKMQAELSEAAVEAGETDRAVGETLCKDSSENRSSNNGGEGE